MEANSTLASQPGDFERADTGDESGAHLEFTWLQDEIDLIESWQERISVSEPIKEHGIFQRYFEACEGLFRSLTSNSNDNSFFNKTQAKSIKRNQILFRLWGLESDIDKGELDARFLYGGNKDLKLLSLNLLRSIEETLTRSKFFYKRSMTLVLTTNLGLFKYVAPNAHSETWIFQGSIVEGLRDEARYYASGTGSNSNDISSEEENESESSLSLNVRVDRAVDRLSLCIKCLMALIQPIANSEPSSNVLSCGAKMPQDFFVDLVRIKLPKANKDLIAQLGEVSWNIRQRNLDPGFNSDLITHEPLIDHSQHDNSSTVASNSRGSKDSGLGSSIPTELSSSSAQDSEHLGGSNTRPVVISEDDNKWIMNLLISNWATHGGSKKNPCPVCQAKIKKGTSKFFRHMAMHVEDISCIILPPNYSRESDSMSCTAGLKATSLAFTQGQH